MDSAPFIGTKEAANFLGLSPRTLEKMRITGDGPDFRKFGRRCLYSIEDIEHWADSKCRRSTSDLGTDGNI